MKNDVNFIYNNRIFTKKHTYNNTQHTGDAHKTVSVAPHSNGSVQRSAASLRTAQARNLILLQREFVVVRDLFVHTNRLLRVYDNFLFRFDGDDFGIAVWLMTTAAEWKREIESVEINYTDCIMSAPKTH